MIGIVITIGPGVVIDTTQACQKKQGSAVVGRRVLNYLTAMFGIHRNRLEPLRQTFAHVLLKKNPALGSRRNTSQDRGPIPEKRQDEVRPAVVSKEEIPVPVAGLREIKLVSGS